MTTNRPPVVRVAPSPTGDPHVGTAYQALFNYAYAQQQGGRFILRIEDTDQSRYSATSEQAIIDALHWLGLHWVEGPDIGGPHAPYRQSERKALYRIYVDQLVASKAAYHCFCTPAQLAAMRQQQEAAKQPPRYDRRCRWLPDSEVQQRLAAGEPSVIRLAMPLEGDTTFEDVIRGSIRFENAKIDDQVLLKSDGFPTYHLGVVVDDHLMGVTLVVRAEEWISSTPKHVVLYNAFGWNEPEWAHMPLLRNADKSKISKRKNPTSLIWFREQGYLPAALLNFLALQGWSMPDGRDLFTLADFIAAFDWQRVVTSGPIFDLTRLDAINGQYIRALTTDDLLTALEPYLPHTARIDRSYTRAIAPLVHERLRRLSDFEEATQFFYVEHPEEVVTDPSVLVPKRLTRDTSIQLLASALERLAALSAWQADDLEATLRNLAEIEGAKPGDLFMVVRVALTGSTATPPLFETMIVLGRQRVLMRLHAALAHLREWVPA